MDASIIEAPTSTKNKNKERDPEMHQTKKGNQWHFGIKMSIEANDTLGLVRNIHTTAANAYDITACEYLLHGKERRVLEDSGYLGIQNRDEHQSRQHTDWLINCRHK